VTLFCRGLAGGVCFDASGLSGPVLMRTTLSIWVSKIESYKFIRENTD
jgi:hypothetical protein